MSGMLFIDLAAQCAPQVPVDLLAAIARVESGVHAWTVRSGETAEIAKSAGEGVALAVGRLDQGQDVSVGLMGLNARTLSADGLSYLEAFDACLNLEAAGRLIDRLWQAADKMGVSPSQAERHVIRGYFQHAFARAGSVGTYEARVRAEKQLLQVALPSVMVAGAAAVHTRTSSPKSQSVQPEPRPDTGRAQAAELGPTQSRLPRSRALEQPAWAIYGSETSSDLVAFSK
jgi:type IV secretion system protein VirB1